MCSCTIIWTRKTPKPNPRNQPQDGHSPGQRRPKPSRRTPTTPIQPQLSYRRPVRTNNPTLLVLRTGSVRIRKDLRTTWTPPSSPVCTIPRVITRTYAIAVWKLCYRTSPSRSDIAPSTQLWTIEVTHRTKLRAAINSAPSRLRHRT